MGRSPLLSIGKDRPDEAANAKLLRVGHPTTHLRRTFVPKLPRVFCGIDITFDLAVRPFAILYREVGILPAPIKGGIPIRKSDEVLIGPRRGDFLDERFEGRIAPEIVE